MVDPVGGVGGIHNNLIFPRSDSGEAVTVRGGGASVWIGYRLRGLPFKTD